MRAKLSTTCRTARFAAALLVMAAALPAPASWAQGANEGTKAIAADPVVIEIKAAIDAEKALGEKASPERLQILRGELAARVLAYVESWDLPQPTAPGGSS